MEDKFDNDVGPVPRILSCHMIDYAANASGDASKRKNCKQFALSITSLVACVAEPHIWRDETPATA